MGQVVQGGDREDGERCGQVQSGGREAEGEDLRQEWTGELLLQHEDNDEDEKVKDKISGDDKKAINDKCDDTIKWLDENQLAEVDEFQAKQKEVDAVCNPIITKLYGAAGGAPGGPDMGGMGGAAGGAPGAGAGGQGGTGPTIEEVD